MAIKKTTHCDQCDKQVNYNVTVGEAYDLGFTMISVDGSIRVKYSNHSPTKTGHYSSPTKDLIIPENICSKECFKAYLNDWVDQLPDITNERF